VDFENYRRRFLYNVSLYKARSHAIESATESVRLAKISYQAGTRTSTEVLDAELDLFRARAGVVRAQVESAEALINLELALGRHI
jgi:OMF family outer membrane factor